MGADEWLQVIRDEGARITATDVADLTNPVASCPGWTAADLIVHVGAVHRWATAHLSGDTDGARAGYANAKRPTSGPELLDWYRESLDALIDALDVSDPAAPTTSFVGDVTVAFWYRRQAHELSVHRWDLDTAVRPGRERPIPGEVAIDGIAEWLEVFVPRFLKRRGVPPELVGRTVHLHAGDVEGGEWLLTLTPEGLDHVRVHAKAEAAVRGSASDLLLAVWHRRRLADMDVVGDRAVADDVLDLVHVT